MYTVKSTSLVAQMVKNLPARWERESACNVTDPWVRNIPWRRKWQRIPVFLPEELHGQRSLVACSPWSCNELDTTE